jgi:hypothetical protein
MAWDATTKLFAVKWDEAGSSSGTTELHRLSILFDTEDPFRFVSRVVAAHAARAEAEALLRYNLYIDCMPSDDTPEVGAEQASRIIAGAQNTAALLVRLCGARGCADTGVVCVRARARASTDG